MHVPLDLRKQPPLECEWPWIDEIQGKSSRLMQAPSLLKRLRYRFKYGLFTKTFQDRLARVGIKVFVFYLVEERLDESLQHSFETGFERFEFTPLGSHDMQVIAKLPYRSSSKEDLLKKLASENICFGLKHQGQLAAFTWADLRECHDKMIRFPLRDNEAYLFDAFTFGQFRGRNIAPYIRYQCYKALNAIGRDTFYSLSELLNTPSIRFKQKLGARFIKLFLYVELFGKLCRSWKLRDYT